MNSPQHYHASAANARLPLAARPLAGALDKLAHGLITMTHASGTWAFSGRDSLHRQAHLHLHRASGLLWRVLRRGDIGLAESFIKGDWSSASLVDLLEVLALNEQRINGISRPTTWRGRLRHRLRDNSRRRSKRNIAHHYDLGNEFYACWLDETLTYSAAAFASPGESLASAQQRKYAQLLDALDARPGERVLEIGCGWGGLAEAAVERGHAVHGITLSREQLAYARSRLDEHPDGALAQFELRDYRDLEGTYDHVASIEMFEAVGERYWPRFFHAMRNALRPGGRAALQFITIDEDCYEHYRRNPDFIQLYIFPGGMLPTLERFERAASAAGFRVLQSGLHGADYARTLNRWATRFTAARERVAALGFDERFLRMWDYYLAYCEAGFRIGRVDLARVTLERVG